MSDFRAWVEIDLDALTHNLAAIRRRAGPGVRVMLVVKADAYGLGAVTIARHAARCGVSALGVGTSREALELQGAGIRLPVLVLGTVIENELADCLSHGIHIGLHSADRRASLQALAMAMGTVANVHLNVDTGMGRLGVLPSRAVGLLEEIHASRNLALAGIMTHVAAPHGASDEATFGQALAFDELLAAARARGILPGSVHVANSCAIFSGVRGPHAWPYDMVRPGIAAYGTLPAHLARAAELRPVVTLASQVVFLKDVPAGTPVGYDATWRAPRPTRIATLSVGYADGVPWSLSGSGEVLLRGRRAPIVGRVSMDYTTVDIGRVPGVCVGDTAILIGRDGQDELRLADVARRAGTIPHELLCSFGKRVERVYTGGDEILPAAPGARTRSLPPVTSGFPE